MGALGLIGAIVLAHGSIIKAIGMATLGLLNKRNNITQDIVLKSGESRRIGNAIVKLATCDQCGRIVWWEAV